jgi:hypothetical protein
MFSLEFIKQQFNIFKASMISFILGTGILIAGSFYFSLNGAQEFVDNQKIFESQSEKVMTSKIDSIKQSYESDKFIFENENANLRVVNDTLRNKMSRTPVNYRTVRKEYQDNIDKNTDIISSNQSRIDLIDDEMKQIIAQLREEEKTTLSSNLQENKSNIITFLIISSIIEMIIMMGIYYDKYYDYRSLKEYEESVINTPEFKLWYKYNYLLGLIFDSTNDVGDKIPTTDNIIELAKIGKTPITKGDFDKFMKLLYHLNIIAKDGNRRVLNLGEAEGKLMLRQYFNIK